MIKMQTRGFRRAWEINVFGLIDEVVMVLGMSFE